MECFSGKHVLVTGGSSGIGLACATEFAKQGAHVSLYGRDVSKLQSARSLILEEASKSAPFATVSIKVRKKAVDVGDATDVSKAIQASFAERPVDVLVCNAGTVRLGYTEDLPLDQVEEQVRTNLLGSIYPVHAALPLMKKRSAAAPAAIVFMCSLSGLSYWYGASVYTATKYAQRGLAETLRVELMPYNIKVVLICPGFTNTPFLEEVEATSSTALYQMMKVASLYAKSRAEDPKTIAKKTVQATKDGTFLVTTSSSPLVIVQRALARGMFPSESVSQWLFEALALPIFRLFSKLASFGIKHDIQRASRNLMTKLRV